MTDESLMPWGKYKGEKIANVPASYLLWLYDNQKCTGEIKLYIRNNLEGLKQEAESE